MFILKYPQFQFYDFSVFFFSFSDTMLESRERLGTVISTTSTWVLSAFGDRLFAHV